MPDTSLQFKTTPGRTVYAKVNDTLGQLAGTVTMAESGTVPGLYTGAFPTGLAAGTYGVIVYLQVGGSPAGTDPDLGELTVGWDGTGITGPWTRPSGFSRGCNSRVQVELDVNASGAPGTGSEDAAGGPLEDYQPVSGLTSVPCRIVQQDWPPPTHMWTKMEQSASAWHKVLFAGVIWLDERHRLRFDDPATNQTRYLYAMGQSKNAHQMGVFSRIDCLEFAN